MVIFLYLFLKYRKAASLHVSLGDRCSCSVCLYDSIKNVTTFPHQTLPASWQSISYLDSIFQFTSAKYCNSLSLWDSVFWLHCNDSKMQNVSDALKWRERVAPRPLLRPSISPRLRLPAFRSGINTTKLTIVALSSLPSADPYHLTQDTWVSLAVRVHGPWLSCFP